jgi:hypothetical protein
MNSMTYEQCRDTYLAMPTRRYFGIWQCRAHNKKIISAESYAAMESVLEEMTKRADDQTREERRKHAEKLAELKKLREENPNQKIEEVEGGGGEDPRIRAGTHEYAYTRHKCGGRGQTQLVCEIVPVA